MKMAWFTPFAANSAIGKVSAQICAELAKTHCVDIWAPRTNKPISTDLRLIFFDGQLTKEKLDPYDTIVYNLGNFAGFHREIMEIAKRISGIVILHDRTMNSFWGQYCCVEEFGGNGNSGIEQYKKLLTAVNGALAEKALQAALDLHTYPFYDQEPLKGISMLEPCLQGAKGVFTHSAGFARELSSISNLPIEHAYLPCEIHSHPAEAKSLLPILNKARTDGRKILVSTGIVHPVKRIDRVTQVLMAHPEIAEKVCYLVIGGYGGEYGEELKRLSEQELKGCLHLLGYQPDDVMWAALDAADLSINLRYPNSEVCSLSLLEQMAVGKPVLTLDRGIYGEMPQDAVLRIRYEDEENGILQTLKALVQDQLDPQIGSRANAFIKTHCSTHAYCEALVRLIERIKTEPAASDLQNRIIQHIGSAMRALGIRESSLPATYASVTDQLARVLGGEECPSAQNQVLGIWIGFPYQIPALNREGISRLMSYLISSMLQYHPNVEIEVWCYSCNEEEVKIICSSVREEDGNRLKIITEKSWVKQLHVALSVANQVGSLDEHANNLVCAVRAASRASIFVPLIFYLDRIAEAGKRLCVPGYDMAVAGHYGEFLEKDPLYAARNSDLIWRAENLAAKGAEFFCNSEAVRQNEILRYIRNLKENHSRVVYLPANISQDMLQRLLPEKDLRKRFLLDTPYLFYPTQIRPYKNVATLLRAFHLLRERYPQLTLVLTGNPQDVPEVDALVQKYGANSSVKLTKNVSETELYSLYRYAAAVPVPSFFEGGFHYQAMEALSMETPIVLADIPIVAERIESLGFTKENCGLSLFAPMDEQELSEKLANVLENRAAASVRQKPFASKLLSYTWKEAAEQYYQLFFNMEEQSAADHRPCVVQNN